MNDVFQILFITGRSPRVLHVSLNMAMWIYIYVYSQLENMRRYASPYWILLSLNNSDPYLTARIHNKKGSSELQHDTIITFFINDRKLRHYKRIRIYCIWCTAVNKECEKSNVWLLLFCPGIRRWYFDHNVCGQFQKNYNEKYYKWLNKNICKLICMIRNLGVYLFTVSFVAVHPKNC